METVFDLLCLSLAMVLSVRISESVLIECPAISRYNSAHLAA